MGRSPNPANRRPAPPLPQADQFAAALAEMRVKAGIEFSPEQKLIGDDETFRQWCERLGREGLKVDGKRFRLDDRPCMAWIYDQVPSTQQQCFRQTLVVMKAAQVGYSVFEILVGLYLGLKFGPATVGHFLPDQRLADHKSSRRFLPIVRSVPLLKSLMTGDTAEDGARRPSAGNISNRRIADTEYVFSYTSGRSTTESIPMDFLLIDEVQEMTLEQIEKTRERTAASPYRFTLMGSTANWPDADIHAWFKRGTRHAFHTRCPTCGALRPLVDYFPDCIQWDPVHPNELTGRPGCYRYCCANGHWIDDPQDGEWIAEDPDALIVSVHFPQTLSPTISPGELMEKYQSSTDKQNFHNRVLGQPYLNPDQTPVTLEHMANCVAAGAAAGVRWKQRARGTFMGIDQMGNYNVVVIKERLEDGRQAVVHVEEVYSDDPFARCSELMELYGVAVCVVEINPNYNDAKRFANRHPGRVFICNSFGSLPEDMLKWGDSPRLDASDRRTDEQERDRWTVRIDQFKCMQTSLARFTPEAPHCLWPDPQELVQPVIKKGIMQPAAVAPRAFHHFTKTALVAERDDATNQYKNVVRKIGIDPHFAYANLLCDVAWARSHGTATFILPQAKGEARHRSEFPAAVSLPGAPPEMLRLTQEINERPHSPELCRNCASYPRPHDGTIPVKAFCAEYRADVEASQPGCPLFVHSAA